MCREIIKLRGQEIHTSGGVPVSLVAAITLAGAGGKAIMHGQKTVGSLISNRVCTAILRRMAEIKCTDASPSMADS